MHIDRRNLLALSGGMIAAGTGLSACSDANTPRENTTRAITPKQGSIVEIVSFRLAAGISDDKFVAAVQASNDFIQKQPGFIARRLSKADDGTWTDHIEWATLELATSAAESFMMEKTLAPFMMAIDPISINISHNKLIVSVG